MPTAANSLVELGRTECLALLATATVGRIVYTQHALPAIRLVPFVLDDDHVVIGISKQLLSRVQGNIVAFEADETDTAAHEIWSVVVTGRAELAPGAFDALLSSSGSGPASADSVRVVRIRTEIVSGRRTPQHDR